MASYILSCCSAADLTPEQLKAADVHYLPLVFSVDGTDYKDDLGQTMSYDQLYEAMTRGVETKTASAAIGDYIDFFTPFLKDGKDILHVSLSTGISGTFNQARSAASILRDDFPDRKILVLDSLCAGSGYGILMEEASKQRAAGLSIEECAGWIENNRRKMNHLFVPTELTYLFKGGRLSKTEALIGGLLNICPMICVDPNGKLTVFNKVKGKKKAMKELVAQTVERAAKGADFDGKLYLAHSYCLEDAEKVAEMLKEALPKADIQINSIGSAMGCHSGPGGIAAFFFGDRETWI